MKILLFLLTCIVASSFGIGLTEGTTNTIFQYALMATMGVSAVVLLTGATD